MNEVIFHICRAKLQNKLVQGENTIAINVNIFEEHPQLSSVKA